MRCPPGTMLEVHVGVIHLAWELAPGSLWCLKTSKTQIHGEVRWHVDPHIPHGGAGDGRCRHGHGAVVGVLVESRRAAAHASDLPGSGRG